jgi:uncharacterized membrane protein
MNKKKNTFIILLHLVGVLIIGTFIQKKNTIQLQASVTAILVGFMIKKLPSYLNNLG